MKERGIILKFDEEQNLPASEISYGSLNITTDTLNLLTKNSNFEVISRPLKIKPWKIFKGKTPPNVDFGENGNLYIFENSYEETKFININGIWKVRYEGYSEEYILQNFEQLVLPNNEETALKTDGSVLIDADYDYSNENAPISKKYADDLASKEYIKKDGSNEMEQDYVPSKNGQVWVKENLTDGNLLLVLPEYSLGVSECFYFYNNNGDIVYEGCLGHIRYFTTQPLTFSDGITRTPTNGYIDIIGDDAIYLDSGAGQENVTKIQVLRYGNRVNWKRLAYYCTNMTEFEVLATDESKVTDFTNAWYYCSSLTSFPVLDVSNGTNFFGAWAKCYSLSSFPELDVSSGVYFRWTWYYCTSLTSFPQLDVSNGAVFNDAWNSCSSLTSFPKLNLLEGNEFDSTWYGCSSLVSFPAIEFGGGIYSFSNAWGDCHSMELFEPTKEFYESIDFSYAWYNCNKLPHCPGGNEFKIYPGSDTTNMCSGTCCTE